MSFELVSFRFASDGTFADATTATLTAGALAIGAGTIPVGALGDHVDACEQLMGQARDDGEVTLTIQVTGGPLVSFTMPDPLDPAQDTVKLHPAVPAYPRAKVLAYLDALLAFGVV